ncbi:hypothetical protein NC652_026147 [Populus alba x Populus x berolinensis]|nr:hypothetical protein NC652_026147 [Populus alba x Populus x berolinensis]
MRRFSVAWWGLNCSFPLTVQAVASRDYAEEVKGGIADAVMLLLSGTSIVLSLILTVFIVFNTKNREIEQSHEVDGRGTEDR